MKIITYRKWDRKRTFKEHRQMRDNEARAVITAHAGNELRELQAAYSKLADKIGPIIARIDTSENPIENGFVACVLLEMVRDIEGEAWRDICEKGNVK